MNTAAYKDEISALQDTISAFPACVSFDERKLVIERLERGWRHLALLEQPKRLPQKIHDRCQRTLNRAAEIINEWVVELAAGCAEAHRAATPPPAKAMADTMRFCNSMKSKGAVI